MRVERVLPAVLANLMTQHAHHNLKVAFVH